VVIDTVAWVRLEDGLILCARPRAKDVFYIPGGKREGAETDLQTCGARSPRSSRSPQGVRAAAL